VTLGFDFISKNLTELEWEGEEHDLENIAHYAELAWTMGGGDDCKERL